ncbi:hypothetical protein ACQQCD_11785 [Pseudarthrobacter sp. J1763]|uniref:hypothetical protein n=1 Tax=Pseudarthrobacter sp. J1763 TaxID=3420445 RepID=UPI003D277E31
MSQALIKIAAGWLTGLLLAIAAAIVTITLVNNGAAGPQEPVREYLAALHNGDGAKALGLLRANVPAANAAMLDGAALKTASSRVDDVKLGSPEPRDGGQMMVPVEYTIDGSHLKTEFLLEKTGTQWLFFNKWSLVPSTLPTVNVSVVNSVEVELNGKPVNAPNGKASFAVFYPGEYEASYTSEYFTAAPQRATVTSAREELPGLNLATQANTALRNAVGGQLKKYLDDCAAEATKQQQLQPNCPFYHVSTNRVEDGTIKWAIKDYPKVSIEPFEGHWVVAPLKGTAQLTAREQDLFTGEISTLKVVHDFSFTTELNVGADKITVTPVVTY